MRAENILDLSTLKQVREDDAGHVYYILAGQEWCLHDWDFLPAPELRQQSGKRHHYLSCAKEGNTLRGMVEFTTPEGLELKAVVTAESVEELAVKLLAHDWPKKIHEGVTWYQGETKFGTTRWEGMISTTDKGILIEHEELPSNTWVVSRELSLSGAILNLHYHGQDHSLAPRGTDGRLFNFAQAASKCLSLIDVAGKHANEKDDKYAAAYEAGRQSVFNAIDDLRRGPRNNEAPVYGFTG